MSRATGSRWCLRSVRDRAPPIESPSGGQLAGPGRAGPRLSPRRGTWATSSSVPSSPPGPWEPDRRTATPGGTADGRPIGRASRLEPRGGRLLIA
jgi:hypothetical protein